MGKADGKIVVQLIYMYILVYHKYIYTLTRTYTVLSTENNFILTETKLV